MCPAIASTFFPCPCSVIFIQCLIVVEIKTIRRFSQQPPSPLHKQSLLRRSICSVRPFVRVTGRVYARMIPVRQWHVATCMRTFHIRGRNFAAPRVTNYHATPHHPLARSPGTRRVYAIMLPFPNGTNTCNALSTMAGPVCIAATSHTLLRHTCATD